MLLNLGVLGALKLAGVTSGSHVKIKLIRLGLHVPIQRSSTSFDYLDPPV
jgi:hypothetical protein